MTIGVVLGALVGSPARADPCEEQFSGARDGAVALRKDDERRKLRHHWLNATRRLEQVAQRCPKSARAPEALLLAGQLSWELSRLSGNREDVDAGHRFLRAVIDGWSRQRVASDASLALARQLVALGDSAQARKVAREALDAGPERKHELKALLESLPAGKPEVRKEVADGAPTAPKPRSAEAASHAGRKEVADDGQTSPKPRGTEAASQEGRKEVADDAATSAKPRGAEASHAGAKDFAASALQQDEKKSKRVEQTANGAHPLVAEAKGEPKTSSPARPLPEGPVAAGKPAKEPKAEKTSKDAAAVARSSKPQGAPPAPEATPTGAAKPSQGGPAMVAGAGKVPAVPSPAAPSVAKGTSAPARPTVADAIRRLTRPIAGFSVAQLPGGDATPIAPHEPVRPHGSDRAPDDVVEDSGATPLVSLQERLRDVRVGGHPATTDAEARARLKTMVRTQDGAELSLAQQLGLKVKRVVIDAGHGGHDTGAIGPGGTREKDAALAIALRLSEKLEALGLEVTLTRDDDTFVKLEDRTRLANEARGDLFISVHCNSAPTHTLRGIETYTLNTSSNRYAIRLAARENATSERGIGDLQYILADLATKANTSESERLAQRVQKSLVRTLSATHKDVRDLGTKEALFFVLLGTRMPAILVETSFVSNPDEEKRLATVEYQDEVAGSISEAVSDFLEERSHLAQLE